MNEYTSQARTHAQANKHTTHTYTHTHTHTRTKQSYPKNLTGKHDSFPGVGVLELTGI
jgi:hypothetical protein